MTSIHAEPKDIDRHCPIKKGAFVATSFGFGPVSKAVTIAKEIKKCSPALNLHFFGDGIDYEFAVQNKIFDKIHRVKTNSQPDLKKLLPVLQGYEFVVSVLNLDILSIWDKTLPPLYFVDSLAWMWNAAPQGIENVAAYFVQDFLLPNDHVQSWHAEYPLVAVPAIMSDHLTSIDSDPKPRVNKLLVNFSGCSNPHVNGKLFEKYALTLSKLIVDGAFTFDEIQICTNQKLAALVDSNVTKSKQVKVDCLPQYDFIEQMQTSRLLLTAPGITTTFEALRANIPFAFLLPQNDSQALLSDIYRKQIGDEICMAFSSFGKEFSFTTDLIDLRDKTRAVYLAATFLEKILDTKQNEIKKKVRLLFALSSTPTTNAFFTEKTRMGDLTGQQVIAENILNVLYNTNFSN